MKEHKFTIKKHNIAMISVKSSFNFCRAKLY